jgi:cytochrome b561
VTRARPLRWSATAKWFHWSTAVVVLVQLPLGWTARAWPLSPLKLDLFVWHKSLGFVVLLLTAMRLAARIGSPAPALPAGMTERERRLARSAHAALYAILVAMPLSGWVVNSAANVPFRIFRWIPVPAIVAPDKAVADAASKVHLALFVLLAIVLVLHVGAALWHHLVRRDDVLVRMLPRRALQR